MQVVGRIFFVNGCIGGGSPPAGLPYWNQGYPSGSPFVNAAKGVFRGRLPSGKVTEPTTFYTNFPFNNPLGDSIGAGQRYVRGYQNAGLYYGALTNGLSSAHHSLVFVTHSMGAAYAEGMMHYLKEHAWTVKCAVHLNPFQPAYIQLSSPASQMTIHFQNPDDPVTRDVGRGTEDNFLDWLINQIPGAKEEHIVKGSGTIAGATYVEWDSGYSIDRIAQVHASPIWDANFWTRLKTQVPSLGT